MRQGRDCLDQDIDRNVAAVLVNSTALLITTASLTYIFRCPLLVSAPRIKLV